MRKEGNRIGGKEGGEGESARRGSSASSLTRLEEKKETYSAHPSIFTPPTQAPTRLFPCPPLLPSGTTSDHRPTCTTASLLDQLLLSYSPLLPSHCYAAGGGREPTATSDELRVSHQNLVSYHI